ncbi:MAG: NAD(P)-dependent alcohol dehydrogenase, partial [Chloroflexota bacterium]
MKASVYTNYGLPNVLQLKEVDKPVPQDNEVLIRIEATTVTAVDNFYRKGRPFLARLDTGLLKPKNPTLGTELAGVIEAIGQGVTQFKIGDSVFASASGGAGTHAEYICLPEDGALALKPASLSYEAAAAIPYGASTALHFLRDLAAIQKGQTILINGASGSIGTFAVQLAHYYGAEITGVCSTKNMDLVASLGVNNIIDYTKTDFT